MKPVLVSTTAIIASALASGAQLRPIPPNTDTLKPASKILPVDEARRDPSLLAFRNRLMAALRKCDVSQILALSDPQVVTLGAAWKDFSGGFRDLLARPKRDLECAAMYRSLTLGGLYAPGMFESNYVAQLYTREPDRIIGCGIYEVATGRNVPVYERPDAKSPVVAHLSYDVILTCILRTGAWARVEYARGRFGYVLDDKLADPGGLRITLQKEATGWKIKALDTYFE